MEQWYQLQNEHEQQMWNEEQERKERTVLARMRRGTYSITLSQLRKEVEKRT